MKNINEFLFCLTKSKYRYYVFKHYDITKRDPLLILFYKIDGNIIAAVSYNKQNNIVDIGNLVMENNKINTGFYVMKYLNELTFDEIKRIITSHKKSIISEYEKDYVDRAMLTQELFPEPFKAVEKFMLQYYNTYYKVKTFNCQ